MKNTEKSAEAYLKTLFSSVTYEPISNESPDFLCDSRIAVEVRVLDQNYKLEDGSHESLISKEIPLQRTIEKLCESYPHAHHNQSWYVHHIFSRPVPDKAITVKETKIILNDFFTSQKVEDDHEFWIGNLKVALTPNTTVKYKGMFMQAAWMDNDSGGFTAAEILSNLDICIDEKAKKIQKNFSKYPEWRLVLVDQIDDARTTLSSEEIAKLTTNTKYFSKIFIISKSDERVIQIK